jgi:hypothetical protein
VGFPLRQFSAIFKIRNAAGQPYVIARKHQINWKEILPLTAIAKSRDEKILRFQKQQSDQGQRKTKGISI